MPLATHTPGQTDHLSTRAALSLYANPRQSLLDVDPRWYLIVALCGSPFLLIGLLIPFFSLGFGPADMAGTADSRPLYALTAAPFLAIGIGSLVPLCRHLLHLRWRRQLLQGHRYAHAAADHYWNPEYCEDVNYRGPHVPLVVAGSVACFVGPFNVVFTLDEVHTNALVIVFILNLGVLATLGFALSAIVHSWRRGRSRVHFDHFPLELGRRPRVTLQPEGMLARARAWHVLWECVQDSEGEDHQGRPLVDVRYSRGWHIQRAQADVGSTHQIELPLPDDPTFGSDLSANPPRYWHLVVAADPPSGLPARFILPVYAPTTAGSHPRTEGSHGTGSPDAISPPPQAPGSEEPESGAERVGEEEAVSGSTSEPAEAPEPAR